MATKACVLRSGGDFRPEHVQWLARQVPGLVCLSDVPVDGVRTIPLRHEWPGWWAKMEMFGPSLDGDVLMLDLDTVVLDMPAMPDRTTVLRDFYRPDLIGSGLMYVTAADRARVWEAFTRDPGKAMASCTQFPRWGDQGFLMDFLADAKRWQDVAPVMSYKVHCAKGLPDGAQVVCFHGKPRPWDVSAPWIPPMARDLVRGTFGDLVMRHKGKRICVMAGGPSLAQDLERVKADVWISVNEHGVRARGSADYIVAMDTTHTVRNVNMRDYLRQYSAAPIIGPWGWNDYTILRWPLQPRFLLSGVVASWVASMMGAHPVILAGFDCHGGDGKTLRQHRDYLPHISADVRVCSGPLLEMYQQYRPGEKRKPYVVPEALRTTDLRDGETVVRVAKPFEFRGQVWEPGTHLRVPRHEVRMQIKHRSLIEVTA